MNFCKIITICAITASFLSCNKDNFYQSENFEEVLFKSNTLTEIGSVQNYMPPETFLRQNGETTIYTLDIGTFGLEKFEDSFTVNIQSGNEEHPPISSGEIYINDLQILRKSDFSSSNKLFSIEDMELNKESVLKIKLNGKPNSALVIWIEGTLDPFGEAKGTFIDTRDNIEYDWARIGEQVWMAENLKATKYTNGTPIPNITSNAQWANLEDNNSDKAYCWYNNDTRLKEKYGALYTYAALVNGTPPKTTNQVQGVCPTGWHVPCDEEWNTLMNYLADNGYNHDGTIGGGRAKIGKSIASAERWYVINKPGCPGFEQHTNNSSGFNAYPNGFRGNNSSGSFHYIELRSFLWSGTESSQTMASYRSLYSGSPNLGVAINAKSIGFGVRCIKD